nr:hypothetical protein [Pseudomonas luteola]
MYMGKWINLKRNLQIEGWAFLLAFGCIFFGFRHSYWLWMLVPLCLGLGVDWHRLMPDKDPEELA